MKPQRNAKTKKQATQKQETCKNKKKTQRKQQQKKRNETAKTCNSRKKGDPTTDRSPYTYLALGPHTPHMKRIPGGHPHLPQIMITWQSVLAMAFHLPLNGNKCYEGKEQQRGSACGDRGTHKPHACFFFQGHIPARA